jgi:hypothetical protein
MSSASIDGCTLSKPSPLGQSCTEQYSPAEARFSPSGGAVVHGRHLRQRQTHDQFARRRELAVKVAAWPAYQARERSGQPATFRLRQRQNAFMSVHLKAPATAAAVGQRMDLAQTNSAKASDTLLILLASWNWAELAKRSSRERVGADHLRDFSQIGLVATQPRSSNRNHFHKCSLMQAILQISLVAPCSI